MTTRGQTNLLGQLLIKANLITEEQLNEALRIQRIHGKRIASTLVKLGYLDEKILLDFLSKQYNVPVINLAEHRIDTSLLKSIPYETAKRYKLIPISKDGASLRIAITDPSFNLGIEDVKFLTNMKVSVHLASEDSIMQAIEKYYPKTVKDKVRIDSKKVSHKDVVKLEDLTRIIGKAADDIKVIDQKDDELSVTQADTAPVVKLANGILMNAINERASDIHIEPSEDLLRVRYRKDGLLTPVLKLPVKIKNPLISRIKIMSHLDISERRLPQDGRIMLNYGDSKRIDLRVSTIPTIFGEKVVMRLLDKSNLQLDLTKLGFDESSLDVFLESLENPYGMILVTGPTGSGKTTTLYSALLKLNKPGVNIITAEDPVEYNFFGINQVQMKEEIGLNFASALRHFLRQDPDIILVGEIRDYETAEISVKAALTGHLVLSTLHTNDAPSTVTRLVNMGVEPILVSSSVKLIMAQRLARTICQNCRDKQDVPEILLNKCGLTPEERDNATLYVGTGCSYCNHTGYKGRIALYEVMKVTDIIKELILKGASEMDIKKEAIKSGMNTLRRSAITKVLNGIMSIDEAIRVTFED